MAARSRAAPFPGPVAHGHGGACSVVGIGPGGAERGGGGGGFARGVAPGGRPPPPPRPARRGGGRAPRGGPPRAGGGLFGWAVGPGGGRGGGGGGGFAGGGARGAPPPTPRDARSEAEGPSPPARPAPGRVGSGGFGAGHPQGFDAPADGSVKTDRPLRSPWSDCSCRIRRHPRAARPPHSRPNRPAGPAAASPFRRT